MKFRNTLILLGILAILGGYVFFIERKSPAGSEGTPTPTTLPSLFSFQTSDIRQLLLERPQEGKQTEIAYQDDGKWHILSPVTKEADQGKVIRFLDSLSSLRPRRILTGTVGQPADYDLAPPSMTVRITLKDGSTHTLKIGSKNPAKSGYYGQIEGDRHIYLLPFYIGADVERYLNNPPVKPTPTPEPTGTTPPRVPPPPTSTPLAK